MLRISLIFLNLVLIFAQINENKVNYYDELISSRIKKAGSFVCPTDYSEFFEKEKSNEKKIKTIKEKYDFIVVGAGAAGAVIAGRLSEIKKWKILLIEAGDYEDDFSKIPLMCGWNIKSERNWCFKTTPQKNALFGQENNQASFIRGKSIGGSTVLNGLGYTRGNQKDYDDWAAQGNPGWSYKDVLPFFKKSENVQIIHNYGYHGFHGELPVTFVELPEVKASKMYSKILAKGADFYNISYNYDFNGKTQMGVSRFQFNVQGKRMSTGIFLKKTPNLKIFTKSLVTVVLFKNKTAIGVKFSNKGGAFQVYATKEVIIAAGVINSPQILMLSGIGPRKQLEELKIEPLMDLPVGENAIEQNGLRLNFKTNHSERLTIVKRTEIKNYLLNRGFLSNPVTDAHYPTLAFVNLKNSSATYPDTEITLSVPINFFSTGDASKFPNNFNKFQLILIDLRPKSRGRITLKSKSVQDFPNIDLNMFSDHQDVENLYQAVQFALNLTATAPFKQINAQLEDSFPNCSSKFGFNSKDYWTCVIKYASVPYLHMVGTTRMGPNLENSVVDSELRVHGVKSLRVADCGVIPVPISGHTSAPATMVGEKAADIIKSFYGVKV